MKLTLICVLFVVFSILVLPGLLAIGIKRIPSGYQPSLDDTQSVYKGIFISQTFTASDNNLFGVALTVKNPYQRNKKDLTFTIASSNGESRSVVINGKNIHDGIFLNFSFDPITDSKGKTFSATFNAPDSESQESLELYHSTTPFNGLYKVNDETKGGSLSFVSYYAPESIFEIWKTIYGNWFNKLLQDLPFAIFYFTCLTLIAFYLVKEYLKNRFIN